MVACVPVLFCCSGEPCHGHGAPLQTASSHGHSHGGQPCHGHSAPSPPPAAHGHSHGGQPCHGHGGAAAPTAADVCAACKKGGADVTLSRCSRCKNTLYCSRDCQTADWKESDTHAQADALMRCAPLCGRHRLSCQLQLIDTIALSVLLALRFLLYRSTRSRARPKRIAISLTDRGAAGACDNHRASFRSVCCAHAPSHTDATNQIRHADE